ncbi:MAG: ABC transporter permease [gamma proteobacterium symbiont of Bathyaustriella thionipta]|nr:ABC transporter permease [gamma proteobacterium symbiont of Bathyaustriella thionipta]MCU7950728.1 ABC transporter permease [gamma proteobacterium symbiont of Bathyaustriella thionipta]MCU7954267.1 ABC transporter permease [gamma proteobacterium symbiont of Bathyaustriella thionipta]MCU7957220.1 ABC transporter permease [gamma proteobacterium symbiont of Bathyaustriella thionipta]MCU7966817.1 ABC transporter permease [gamma proteobacterium symbiont of Bathyaustriella thionipta]
MKRFLAILHARNLEFIRDRAALSWGLIFPTALMMGFALVFSNGDQERYKVGIAGEFNHPFLQSQYIKFIPVENLEKAIIKVERHQLDLLIASDKLRYWVNSSSPGGYITEQLLKASGGEVLKVNEVSGKEIRYIDWLIPGVLGMNMMFSALFGIGFVIVRYRKNGVLKRLRGTPLSATEFLMAQIFSRLLLIIFVSVIVYIGCDLILDFSMYGSYINLFLVFAIGSLAMISLGLLIASRLKSDELAAGLTNAISIPMMLLSGVWFSLEGSPQWILFISNLLPLTHVVDASRAIMLEGAGIIDVSHHILIMLLMMLFFLFLGVKLFRWE